MIIGSGIDIVEIARFDRWAHFSIKQLHRFFHPNEISYILSNKRKSSERFAARFAAREACLKALTPLISNHHVSLLSIARAIEVQKDAAGMPILHINWGEIGITSHISRNLKTHISLSHTRNIAIAQVIIEQIPHSPD